MTHRIESNGFAGFFYFAMILIIIQSIILLTLFFIELAALFGYGYWGFHVNKSWVVRIVLGIGTPLLIAVHWAMFVAPKAAYPVSVPVKVLLQSTVFAFAAVALYFSARKTLPLFSPSRH